jgi:hypothetical protein
MWLNHSFNKINPYKRKNGGKYEEEQNHGDVISDNNDGRNVGRLWQLGGRKPDL